MQEDKILIKIENINKTYLIGDEVVKALDNISLRVEEGEFVAIIGQSGSGKSTLMNMLGCLDIPSEGKYFLDGKDVSSISDSKLSKIRNEKIGFIFQGFNLVPGMSASDNVELPLMYRGLSKAERKQRAHEALIKVGLKSRLYHKPSQMSGGQQQKVAIARAISASPPIILADEPTGNLDSNSGCEVMNILKGLNQEGKTLILITHDIDIAKMAHRIIKISDGKICADYNNKKAVNS